MKEVNNGAKCQFSNRNSIIFFDTHFRLQAAYWSFRYKSIDDIKIHDDFPL